MINICIIFTFERVASAIALLLSLVSVIYISRKYNRELRIAKLKQDKAILYPLLHENYDYILQISGKFDPEKIKSILQLVKIDKLDNQDIRQKIKLLKEKNVVYLDSSDGGIIDIEGEIEELFIEIRYYLAEVI